MPSMYCMFKMNYIVPLEIHLKEGVQSFVFKGADLMWPGVREVKVNGQAEGISFKQGQVAVVYAVGSSKMVPVATGRMLGNYSEEDDDLPSKGKAV